MSTNRTTAPAQIAVWLFISATFAFAATSLYDDAPMWLRTAFTILGFVLVIAGGVRLGQELVERRDARNASGAPAPGTSGASGASGTPGAPSSAPRPDADPN